ncbi:hypothetical protein [Undibacterium umbellatum]|uniref:Uncharacterized protein n=1 Tax=Undibacterium umbellatum TaxID=2762300 RepID=A0ABR6ZIQ5_9BURK|nr:hypothetical protein [Undibacterium umbellatum]MBC3911603.1 hypothetical protein [Undibacterium umbellatum]
MNPSELAKEIINELYKGNFFVLLYAMLAFSALSFFAYLGGYFTSAGKLKNEMENFKDVLKNEVAKFKELEQSKYDMYEQNFAQILKQQTDTTETVEAIKSRIGRNDWVQKEMTSIRIKKIEELVTLVMKVEEVLNERLSSALDILDLAKNHEHDTENLLVIVKLYLPDLTGEALNFIVCAKKFYLLIYKKHRKMDKATSDEDKQKIRDTIYDQEARDLQGEIWSTRNILIEKARIKLEYLLTEN